MSTEINKDTANDAKANDRLEKRHNAVPDAIWLLVIVAIMIGAGAFIYLRSDIHRLKYIEHQLKGTYGITCTDGDVSDEFFNVQTADGITVKGTCSRTGNITAETYINYYYGAESAQRITDEIGDCFDECVIVANNEYLHNWTLPVATGSIGSYDEYLASRLSNH